MSEEVANVSVLRVNIAFPRNRPCPERASRVTVYCLLSSHLRAFLKEQLTSHSSRRSFRTRPIARVKYNVMYVLNDYLYGENEHEDGGPL